MSLNVGNVRVPVGLLAQPPGDFPIVHDSVSHVEICPMDRFQKILQVIAFVVGAILAMMGQNAKVQVETDAAAGAYSSRAEAASDIADAGNKMTAGFATMISTVLIPFAFQFVAPWFGKAKPGYRAAADRAACETLLLSRVNVPADIAKIKELIASGVQLEVDQLVEAATKKVA